MIALNTKAEQKHKSSSLFLIELILVLLFFMISGAVIMTVFAGAAGAMGDNQLTDNAVLCGQSIAEAYSVTGDLRKSAGLALGTEIGDTEEIRLDSSFKLSESGIVSLSLKEATEETSAGSLKTAEAVFTKDGEELYSLTFSAYIPNEGVSANE